MTTYNEKPQATFTYLIFYRNPAKKEKCTKNDQFTYFLNFYTIKMTE